MTRERMAPASTPTLPRERGKGSAPERAIGGQLALGFGTIATLGVALCVALMLLLVRVGTTLEEVRADGETAREALSIALSVREHYQHEAHTVIARDDHEMSSHAHWLVQLQDRARRLRPGVPPEEQARLDELVSESAALDRAFRREVMPAAMADDEARLRTAHGAAEAHTARAAAAADAVVAALERRMERLRERAATETRVAIGTGVVGVATLLVLALLFSVRLRRAILAPLARLTEAAQRLGAGERDAPLGEVGIGELRIVAHAFDAMADRIAERERALVRQERLAAVGQLAAGVAHEINNPIAVIRGYLKTMVPEARDEEQAEELRILDQEAAACQRIVEDLLTYGRDPGLAVERVDAETLLGEAAARFRATELGATVALALDVEPATFEADPGRLRQVVDNLLTNAAQHSAAGARVELRGRAVEGAYRIEVADHGPGIAEEDRERIFEPFRTSRPGGTGLGLAVSRVIVRAHGGTITALAREEGGTVMRVELRTEEAG
ncbi:MAG: HAMP domain-containing protein [Myxococcales bacterium]|nr:HAMP domain-containing protein [Myxococcales bacterium]